MFAVQMTVDWVSYSPHHFHVKRQDGDAAVMWAAMNGRLDCLRLLVEFGADADAKNNVRVINAAIHNNRVEAFLRCMIDKFQANVQFLILKFIIYWFHILYLFYFISFSSVLDLFAKSISIFASNLPSFVSSVIYLH